MAAQPRDARERLKALVLRNNPYVNRRELADVVSAMSTPACRREDARLREDVRRSKTSQRLRRVHVSSRRRLNPRVCRGCGYVFLPETALQRYGRPSCKRDGRSYQSRAVPGAAITHR